ncbi:MAG: hypothetical protein ABJG68_12600 [Crocinitomicaceae bacterium]
MRTAKFYQLDSGSVYIVFSIGVGVDSWSSEPIFLTIIPIKVRRTPSIPSIPIMNSTKEYSTVFLPILILITGFSL